MEFIHRALVALDDDLGEADLVGVRHAIVDRGESSAVEEIQCVHGVATLPYLLGEGMESGVWPRAWWNHGISAPDQGRAGITRTVPGGKLSGSDGTRTRGLPA